MTYGLGPAVPIGDARCTYAPPPEREERCGKPGVFHHLILNGPEGLPVCLISCVDHVEVAFRLSDDSHNIGNVCDMPGTEWHWDTPSYCIWPVLEDEQAQETSELTLAGSAQ